MDATRALSTITHYANANPGIVAMAISSVAVMACPTILTSAAFSAAGLAASGPVAGSAFALLQSTVGGTPAIAATLQSAAMGGYGVAIGVAKNKSCMPPLVLIFIGLERRFVATRAHALGFAQPLWRIIVGHGLGNDDRYLRALGFSLGTVANTFSQADTQRFVGSKAQVSLKKLLAALEIDAVNLHSAGNDAVYTMLAFAKTIAINSDISGRRLSKLMGAIDGKPLERHDASAIETTVWGGTTMIGDERSRVGYPTTHKADEEILKTQRDWGRRRIIYTLYLHNELVSYKHQPSDPQVSGRCLIAFPYGLSEHVFRTPSR
ncbi:hypothetical protein Q7P37_009805 [Cladosporium fusiforme]